MYVHVVSVQIHTRRYVLHVYNLSHDERRVTAGHAKYVDKVIALFPDDIPLEGKCPGE